jgi:UDP-GlcNAc:undecaprenyl-phosphate GlcNAc-1-phosphate transferase
LAFLAGLIATLVVTPLVIRVSTGSGLVDTPGTDPLKVHQIATPRSGGIAVAVGLLAGGLLSGQPSFPLVFGGGVALLLGLVDDWRAVPAGVRLWIEIALATSVAIALIGPDDWTGILVATLTIVVAINAANLYDGLDGLLPSAGAMAAVGLAVLGGTTSPWLWALAGGLTAFLFYNRPPARVFLGDGGAYLVGMVLAAGLVDVGNEPRAFLGAALAFGLIGLDFVLTLFRRVRAGTPLFVGDRSHLYDQLRDRGWSTQKVLLVLGTFHAGLVIVGVVVATGG